MDKKTKTIVVVVLAVVVVGGAFYGFRRWQQQRLVNQYLKGIYGTDAGGLLGKLTGGSGGISSQVAQEIAKEMAKEEARQKVDEVKETAKTPADRYNETQEAIAIGTVVPILNSEIKPVIEKVFGKAKMVMYSGGYAGTENSFLTSFKVPRIITAQDLGSLAQEFTGKGYKVVSNTADANSGTVMMEKEGVYLSFSYEGSESQELGLMYVKQ